MNITVTDKTVNRVTELLENAENASGLRIFVQGGGCSGFQYGFAFEDTANEDDFVHEVNNVKFFVDAMSAAYLEGAIVDYVEELMGSHFEIVNPNATTTCGCGSSFSA